jgi:hypothetical protein
LTEQEIARVLALHAASVARSAPYEWGKLLETLKIYTDHRRDECVSSPSDAVFLAQGRAREAASLLRMLENCKQTADQIAEKRK